MNITNKELDLLGFYTHYFKYKKIIEWEKRAEISDNLYNIARAMNDEYKMRLYMKEGTKVKFVRKDKNNIGSDSAVNNLVFNGEYTVSHTSVGGCNAYCYLKEIPDKRFKVTCFEPVGGFSFCTYEEMLLDYNGYLFADLEEAEKVSNGNL